jgi:hypothetical protein
MRLPKELFTSKRDRQALNSSFEMAIKQITDNIRISQEEGTKGSLGEEKPSN